MEAVEAPILIVDDHPENLVAMEATLSSLGQPIVTATSGGAALSRLLERDFALIILDVRMPGMDGVQTAEIIRSRPRTAHIPIIFITGESHESKHVMRAYRQGAVDYLVKPVDQDILRSKVVQFVELYVRGELLRRREAELTARRCHEEEAVRAAQFEEQLVAIVGHDLRSPLATIRASTQLSLRRELSADERKSFERIDRAAVRMTDIVALLLDFTRARVGGGLPIQRKRTCVNELVRQLVDDFCASHPTRKIEMEANASAIGHLDAARMTQAVSNLLDNACKYGAKHEPITVAVSVDGDTASVKVHNFGPAIPEELQQSMFDPFERAATRRISSKEGLGLGLFIVREIARAHGGDVYVESTPGDGTSFSLVIPLQSHLEAGSEEPSSSGSAEPGPESEALSAQV